MKALLLTLALLPATFATAALAEPLAIFARDDARKSIDAPPSDACAATFFATFFQDRSAAVPFEGSLALVNPPSWGKTISRTTGGGLTYHRSFAGGFVAKLTLHGLASHHTYILTLNGNPELAGNELLLTPVPGLEEERYYDFLDIRTDADGRYEGELGVYLKKWRLRRAPLREGHRRFQNRALSRLLPVPRDALIGTMRAPGRATLRTGSGQRADMVEPGSVLCRDTMHIESLRIFR
ncbi:MAG: hypothetical protein NVV63_13540 [Opitutus sp.]|nr:hypothetical protein [Opitutus sp.]